jgi:hypothetical protein
MSIGGGIGAVVGGIIGYYFGGAQGAYMGASLGMTVGTAIDPPGARMGGTSQYKKQDIYYNSIGHNLPVPIVYGVNRVAGNVLWLGNISVSVTGGDGGGKGGSGGGGKKDSPTQQTVTVHGDFAVAISEGEILAITEVFIGDKLITDMEGLSYTVYLGTQTQTADPRLVTDLGDLAPTFRNTAYIALGGDLGSSPALPQVNTEVVGKFTEPYSWGNPALIVQDILVHPRYGIDVTSTRIDSATFTAAYSYCVGMTPSGITSAEAAALSRPYVPASLTSAVGWTDAHSGVIWVSGLGDGYSAGLYNPDGTLVVRDLQSVEGSVVLSSSLLTGVVSGYLQIYTDGAGYTTVATHGRSPAEGFTDFNTGIVFTYTPPQEAYEAPRTDAGLPGEQRFCLDYIVDEYRPVVEHLRDMLATFGGFLTWSQGLVKLHIDQPGATVTQSFGMSEILADSFRWKRQSYRERPNVVRIEYVEPGALTPEGNDPGTQALLLSGSYLFVGDELATKKEYKTYRQDFVEASDPWDIDRTGERRERVLNLTGIKRRSQAQRMAYYYLNKSIHCSHACAFNVSINALHAEVGDVIAVSHDIPQWHGKLFRIAEIQESENDELVLGCLEHSEAVYADSAYVPRGQDPVTGADTNRAPVNVGRLSVYARPYEDTIEIAYTRIATADLFRGTDLYLQRGAAEWVSIDESVLTNAPTAYLQTSIPSLTLTTSGEPADYSNAFTIRGVPDGYSAALFWPTASRQALAVATMGTITLTPQVITPGSGYIQLYSTATSPYVPAPLGRYPATPYTFTSHRGGDVYDYARVPQVISAVQDWIPIERPMGGWTNGESLRIEAEEIGYTTFTDSMLTGVTRGGHDTLAVTHTGIVSLGMVAVQTVTGESLADLTTEFRDPLVATEFFGQNSAYLYVGANSKFSALNLWLARNASHMLGIAGEYSTGQGAWASMVSSSLVPPIDASSGMQTSGQISWEPMGNWAPTHEVTSGGLHVIDATDRYYIRLMRVASLCVSIPAALELVLTNDVLATVRKSGAFLYTLTLADSGQTLTFKAVSRGIGGASGDSAAAPTATYQNT